ncbi:MAG: branched-chain amino acid ABC transporter permease [Stomatobaculum sp.]
METIKNNALKSNAWLKILLLCAVIIAVPLLTPNMYIMQIINMICIYIILGTSINVLTGFTGQLSLGQAAFFGIGAYTTALLNTRAGLQFFSALLGSVLVTALFGVILAIPALKVKGSYLALLTMGFGEVVRIVMINWTPVTNGTSGILGIESPVILGFAFDTLKKYYFLIMLFVILGLLYQNIIIRTRTGRAFVAIREDNEAAELTGINVTAYKIRAFVLSAVYCGVAGCLYAMMIRYVSPDTFTNNVSSVILWTAIVGGFGTVAGPVFGGIIMQVLPEALRFLGDWRLVLYGVILLIVILRFPGGLYPYIRKRWVSGFRKKAPSETAEKR